MIYNPVKPPVGCWSCILHTPLLGTSVCITGRKTIRPTRHTVAHDIPYLTLGIEGFYISRTRWTLKSIEIRVLREFVQWTILIYIPRTQCKSDEAGTMRSTHTKQSTLPFGFTADVLFQIIINGEASSVLSLCLLNRATYDTIKVVEPHICTWFMRLHGIDTFDPILTLNPWTGQQTPITVHSLVRFLYRHNLARHLSLHIIPSVWGPFSADEKVDTTLAAELKLASHLERGLYVLFHMSSISLETQRIQHPRKSLSSLVTKRLSIIAKTLDEYDKRTLTSFEEHTKHVYTVFNWGHAEAETGKQRLEFRSLLDDQSQIDLHCTFRMLRELLERMLLRHGLKYWRRDTRDEYSITSWFLLNQSPRTLEHLFLSPQDECCQIDTTLDFPTPTSTATEKCLFSTPLDQYWDAWRDIPDLGCIDCDCKLRGRSWSVKPALFDARGREFNRAAEKYLKEMWSQRHAGVSSGVCDGSFCVGALREFLSRY
ncbi:hypothetical protein BDV12DRAFT_171290 [Aspergillus spectabilis]